MSPEAKALLEKYRERSRADIHQTPNQGCPACRDFRLHSPEEWRAYHPLAGHHGGHGTAPAPGESGRTS
jgi:hypothetical protein